MQAVMPSVALASTAINIRTFSWHRFGVVVDNLQDLELAVVDYTKRKKKH
jgi:hypothetical protein